MISKGVITVDAVFSEVMDKLCSGCRICNSVCPYSAIEYDAEKKKRLMDCYPTFDATTFSKRFFREVITYQPETYIAAGSEKPEAAPSRLRIDSELTRDFLHFFHRKWRAKVGWW